jgi:hypothetical protein
MSDRNNAGAGLSLSGVLTVVFVVLKLTDNIDWSWWWVLSPLWIPWGVVLFLCLVVGVVKVGKAVKR